MAGYVSRLAAEAAAETGQFTVALSGGSLPKLLAKDLVSQPNRSRINWASWHVFWADERCVPLDHPDSNYVAAKTVLFDQVEIPPDQIYVPNCATDPEAAAVGYEQMIRRVLQPKAGHPPRFDLILLGMGEDGHTASLFPDHPLLAEKKRWVVPIYNSPKPPPRRVTLTLPVINNAGHVAFLITGAGKAEVLPRAVTGTSPTVPAGLVTPLAGRLDWFVDEAAAANLNPGDL